MYPIRNIMRGVRNLWKNWRTSMNCVLIIGSALAVLGVIAVLYLNVVHISQTLFSNTTVSLFLQDNLTDQERKSLLQRTQRHPLVKQAQLVTPEQGLQAFSQKLKVDHALLADIQAEALPYTIDLELFVNYRGSIGKIASQLAEQAGVEEAVYARRLLDKVKLFFDLTKSIGLFFSALLLISFCLIIGNATRLSLHARRTEVEILHLAGATQGFIRSIFLIESVLLSTIGWVLALLLVLFIHQLIIAGLTWNAVTMHLKGLSVFFPWQVLVISLPVIMLSGGLSSLLAVNHTLRELEP